MTIHGTSRWGYLLVWRFRIKPEFHQQFENVYGPEGEWAKFFSQNANYCGTDLVRDANDQNQYITLDYWTSRAAYDQFRRQYADAYKQIDQHCEEMTEEEITLGAFERVQV